MQVKKLGTRPWLPWAALAYGVGAHWFFLARFGGRWVDSDTGWMRVTSDQIWNGSELPSVTNLWTSAVGYPLLAGFLARALDVSTVEYQQVIQPLFGTVLLFGTLFLARALELRTNAQAIAVFLVGASPDLLFESSRGSHGPFTLGALAFALGLLIPLLRRSGKESTPGLMFLLAFLVESTILNFKRTILIGAIVFGTTAVVALYAALHRESGRTFPSRKIVVPFIAVGVGLVLINGGFGFHEGGPLDAIRDQVRVAVGQADEPSQQAPAVAGARDAKADSAWGYLSTAWVSPVAFFLFSSWNLLVGMVAILGWIALTRRIFGKGVVPNQELVLWAWTALAGILTVAVVAAAILSVRLYVDPLRVFTYLAIAAAFLSAFVVSRWTERTWFNGAARFAFFFVACGLAVAAPLKAVNEPAINNHWRFYSSSEGLLLDWLGEFENERNLWIGPDDPGWENRLNQAYLGAFSSRYSLLLENTPTPTRWIDSRIVQAHAERMDVTLPSHFDYHRTYDNGDAKYYVAAGLGADA